MSNTANQYEPAPATAPEPEQPRGSSRGCLYGCLFMVVAGIALVVCAGIGGYWFVKSQVEKYTSTTPVELPTVEFSDEQMAQLQARVEAFGEAIDQGETPDEDLVLTAEEINALIAQEEKLRGKVFIRIEEGHVSGDVSIPTDAIPGGKGRYFNGSASLDVSMENGVLIVTLVDAEVNGERLPQEAIDAMAQQNLAKDVYQDPKNARILRQFESIAVEGDTIVLKVKRDPTDETADESDSDDSGGNQTNDGEAGGDASDSEEESQQPAAT